MCQSVAQTGFGCGACVTMTQSIPVSWIRCFLAVFLAGAACACGADAFVPSGARGQSSASPLPAQEADESYSAPGEHPALLLNTRRLRLLRRERERQSMRWQQVQALIAGKASLPEPGFALGLYYQVAGDAASGRRAVEWALDPAADLRQAALVFDWCQAAMTPEQAKALQAKLEKALARHPDGTVGDARSRALAALALAAENSALSSRELERLVKQWWRGSICPALEGGHDVVPRTSLYALFEMLHAIHDNLQIDLRESARVYFRQLPVWDMLSYYPAAYAAPENDYRIPAVPSADAEPRSAALARAADLAMVAFDPNSNSSQFLQGWLLHDRFLMHGPGSSFYEFLWANPYLPGLSYYNAALRFYDPALGKVFVRSSWEDDAEWAGSFGGQLQTFANGEPRIIAPPAPKIARVADTAIVLVAAGSWPEVDEAAKHVYLVGLEPRRSYLLEIEQREMQEEVSDPGGVIALDFPAGFRGAIRVREFSPSR